MLVVEASHAAHECDVRLLIEPSPPATVIP